MMRHRGGEKGMATRGRLVGVGVLIMSIIAAAQIWWEGGDVASLISPDRQSGATAQATRPEDLPFAYYVLSLSWSPSFCRDNPGADQCGQGRRFVLHGLWPNQEQGWDTDCATEFDRPSRAVLRRHAPISAGEGLLAYQWRKHGACSGLSPEVYFETMRRAYESIAQPPELTRLERDLTVDPEVIEAAFLDANPALGRDGVTVTCKSGGLAEVRICLTPELAPRDCGARTRRDCSAASIELPAPK